MRKIIKLALFIYLLIAGFISNSIHAQYVQQGPKLVGTGSGPGSWQGSCVSISSDGNTAVIGASGDNNSAGAVWVYTRTAGVWSQQGTKLVGSGAVQTASQGWGTAISADGNTIITGGQADNGGMGAVWFFTRSGGVWTQQGTKKLGSGYIGLAEQGTAVSLSGDGNTAVVGGPWDNGYMGALWIYTRTAGVWTQEGNKLVGTGGSGHPNLGTSVSISYDGNTVLAGGPYDSMEVGAAWIFRRTAGIWSQLGNKLVGTGAIGGSYQGYSVAVSPNGNTAIIGGYNDNNYFGAAWIFINVEEVLEQQGNKLVGTGAIGNAGQGGGVSISYSGDTAVVGGEMDNSAIGATWVYTRSGTTWSQLQNKLTGTGITGGYAEQGASVSISSDASTIVSGGIQDNNYVGAAWMFATPNTGVETIKGTNNSVIVYPNPAKATLSIRNYELGIRNGELSITDILGNEVYHQPSLLNRDNSSQTTIDISNLSNGVYFYEIRIPNESEKETMRGKFVKD